MITLVLREKHENWVLSQGTLEKSNCLLLNVFKVLYCAVLCLFMA